MHGPFRYFSSSANIGLRDVMAPGTFQSWNFKANPFAYSRGPLQPNVDQAQLSYYFDFYAWNNQAALDGLAPDGRVKNLVADTDGQTMTFLISGAGGCGRSSMKNLLLYELGTRAQSGLLTVEALANLSISRAQSAMSLTQAIASTVGAKELALGHQNKPTSSALLDAAKTWKGLIVDAAEPDTGSLFQTLKGIVRQAFPDEWLVVTLDALNPALTQDTARTTRDMLDGFADFIIFALTDADHARFIRNKCQQAMKPIFWVNAPKVSKEAVTKFLDKRFADERTKPAPVGQSLHPFTKEAISILFDPSRAGDPAVTMPLRVAIKKLESALTSRLANGKSPGGPITGPEMRAFLAGQGNAP